MKYYPSWWEKTELLKPFDYLVLGAGLIGKQIAIKLKIKFPQARIALVDRSPLSYGASTRNAGFACFGSISEIEDDFKRSPVNEVINLAMKRYQGIQKLMEEYGQASIGLEKTGSYEIFNNKSDFEKAAEQVDKMNRLFEERGLKKVFQKKETSSFKMNCEKFCYFNPYEGLLNTGQLNACISDKAHRLGIIPLYGLNIESFEKEAKSYRLFTDSGMELIANQLILATNAFSNHFLPDFPVETARGQIILTKPLETIPFNGIFHADKGYIYFRNLGNRVLIGGGRNHFLEDENTADMSGSTAVIRHLETYLKTVVLPHQAFETDMHWSGIMAMGEEKIPLVKRLDAHLSVCIRMSGMGVALGPVLSEELIALME